MADADLTEYQGLIHDWNQPVGPTRGRGLVELVDETLRDGCQSPSTRAPTHDDRVQLIHAMDGLGIAVADIGLPGAGPAAQRDIASLLDEIQSAKLRIRPMVACRTLIEPDLRAAADLAQRSGSALTVYTFIGSSPIRQWAEDWPLSFLLEKTSESIEFLVREGLEAVFVTEDTTRSTPATLSALFDAAVRAGASGLCLCDTSGFITDAGLARLFAFTKDCLAQHGAPELTIDWHGHNDRGLSLSVALTAIELGFDRVHGCGLGIGERVGNTPIDLLIMNLKLAGPASWPHDVSGLADYVRLVSRVTEIPIPNQYPLCGRDAFRTATGVHAAAIRKALKKQNAYLADRVYCGVPAGDFGQKQQVEVGSMSGLSNVLLWLEQRGLDSPPTLVDFILQLAKRSNRVLTDQEIAAGIDEWQQAQAPAPVGLALQTNDKSVQP